MKTIRDFNLKNKRVLVRCDFNVPLDNQGNILDDSRIKETLPTIEYLVKEKAKIVLMSHLGDPGGKVVDGLKLDKVQEKLLEYLDLSITKAPDCVGGEIEEYTKMLSESREQALDRMVDNARELGANAVVTTCFASAEIMNGAAELLVYGTAVIIED